MLYFCPQYLVSLLNTALTVSVFIRFSVAGRVILDHRPVDAVAETFVHVHRNLVGDAYEEIDEESALPAV